jgi:hypothetical protein
MVAYSLLLWFPLYLSEQFDATGAAADLLSTLYDVGGVVGGIAFGVLSDWAFARGMGRSLVIMVMLLLSAVTLALFALIFESSLSGTAFLMTLTGLFSNSAYNLDQQRSGDGSRLAPSAGWQHSGGVERDRHHRRQWLGRRRARPAAGRCDCRSDELERDVCVSCDVQHFERDVSDQGGGRRRRKLQARASVSEQGKVSICVLLECLFF